MSYIQAPLFVMGSNAAVVPAGYNALLARPGDVLLCHRSGFASAAIRGGERLRFQSGARWSHCALVETPTTIIEALTHGVKRSSLSAYTNTDYMLIHTQLDGKDAMQAVAFAQSCIGQEYGFLTDFAIALRFLTPGRGLALSLNGTEICSGLVAQALCRGWANFPVNPASITPAEIAEYYSAPTQPTKRGNK
jgi:cell wall-associated NlpC family hydrolase